MITIWLDENITNLDFMENSEQNNLRLTHIGQLPQVEVFIACMFSFKCEEVNWVLTCICTQNWLLSQILK